MDELKQQIEELSNRLDTTTQKLDNISNEFNDFTNKNTDDIFTINNSISKSDIFNSRSFQSSDNTTEFDTSLDPDEDDTYSLGTSSLKWSDVRTSTINGEVNNFGITKIYHGGITYTGGEWTSFPTDWSVARRSGYAAGSYKITHSLDTTTYIVVATTGGQANTFIVCQDRSNNSMILSSFDSDGNLKDADIFFTLIQS